MKIAYMYVDKKNVVIVINLNQGLDLTENTVRFSETSV